VEQAVHLEIYNKISAASSFIFSTMNHTVSNPLTHFKIKFLVFYKSAGGGGGERDILHAYFPVKTKKYTY
jgi:hypothetical protein